MASINDYLPFQVDSNNNPPGYDSTTGLYTHPNGQFWLRTGFTLQGVTSTYPNATTSTTGGGGSSGFIQNGTLSGQTITNAYALATNGSNTFYIGDGSTNIIEKFTLSGTTFTRTATITTTNPYHYGFYWDTANNRLYSIADVSAAGNEPIEIIDTSTDTSLGTCTVSFAVNLNPVGAMTSDGTTLYIPHSAGTPQVYEVPLSSVVVGGTPTATLTANLGIGPPVGALGYDGTNFYATDFTDIFQFSGGTWTGAAVSVATLQSGERNFVLYDNNTEFWTTQQGTTTLKNYYNANAPTTTVIGDATARTDTPTGKPMFIRLK